MAVTFVQRTIGGAAKDVIVVSGTGDTEKVILKEYLSAEDLKQLDVVSGSAGATFADKLAATTLSNGRKASSQFASLIKLTTDLQGARNRAAVRRNVVYAVTGLQSDVAELQADVEALQNP